MKFAQSGQENFFTSLSVIDLKAYCKLTVHLEISTCDLTVIV